MKTKLYTLLAVVAFPLIGQGAITVNIANFDAGAGQPFPGVAIVDGSNDLLATSGYGYTVASFAPGFDFNTTASDVLSGAVRADGAGISGGSFAGALNLPTTYNGGTAGAPTGIVGQLLYVIVGNNTTDLFASTEIAVFSTPSTFLGGDVAGNGSVQVPLFEVSQVEFGNRGGAPNSQPNAAIGFDTSVGLAALQVPEPSIALLGAFGLLGLIRRRR